MSKARESCKVGGWEWQICEMGMTGVREVRARAEHKMFLKPVLNGESRCTVLAVRD